MKPKSKQDKLRAAFGHTIAANAELRALKKAAEAQLQSGEPEEAVKAWLREQTREQASDAEKAAGFGEWLVDWLLGWAKCGRASGLVYPEFGGQVQVAMGGDFR